MNSKKGFSLILILTLVGVILAILILSSLPGVGKIFKSPKGTQISLQATNFAQEDEEDQDEVDELENVDLD